MDHRNSNGPERGVADVLGPFILCPLGAAGVLTVWALRRHAILTGSNSLQDVVAVIFIFTLLSYLAALVVGVPILLLVRGVFWLSPTTCVIGGAAGGLVFTLVPCCFWYGILKAIETCGSEMAVSAAAGMASGLLFILIHRPAPGSGPTRFDR